MHTIKNAVLFFLLATIVLSGCTKDGENPPEETKAELLLGKWLLTGFTTSPARDANGDGVKETDIFAIGNPCARDFLFIFKPAGVWQIDNGELKCNADEPQIITTGSWVLSTDRKTVTTTDDDGGVDIFEILQLDDKTLKLRVPNVYGNNVTHQDLLTFRRL